MYLSSQSILGYYRRVCSFQQDRQLISTKQQYYQQKEIRMRRVLFIAAAIFLTRLSLAVLSTPPTPFSYVQTLQFQSHHFAPYYSGSFLALLFNITLTYTDPFAFVSSSSPTTAIALSGLQNPGKEYIGFGIEAFTGANAYSTTFQVTFYGATELNYISFFFVMINSTATTYFTIININETGIGLTSAGSPVQSPDRQIPKPASYVSGSSNCYYFIQSFKVDCGSSECFVEVRDKGVTATTLNFEYRTDGGNDLDGVVLNIIVYTPVYSPPIYYAYGFATNDFPTLISAVHTDTAGNGFANGFNGKCLLGSNKFVFSITFFGLKFDMNVVYPNITNSTNYIHSSSPPAPDLHLTMFCLLQRFDCSLIDTNCIRCNTQSTYVPTCTDCINAYYVSGGLCSPCAPLLVGCIHCENDTVCLACDSPAYYYDAVTTRCLDCITFLTHCQNCSSISQCDLCEAGYGLNNATSCLACGILITNCQFCTDSTHCSSCVVGYYLNAASDGCLSCSSIPNCISCFNSTFCNGCLSDFSVNAANQCVCNPGLYPVTGFCSCLGCISAYKFTGMATVTCLACDASLRFQLINGACSCHLGFNLTAGQCVEVCGDGMVFSADCDDGNLVNGDGCSNQCTLEGNYQCFNGTTTNASVCLYKTPLNPTIKNVVKTLDSNRMEIQLEVNNPLAPLDLTAIADFITLSIGGIPFTDFSASFDTKLAVVTLLVPYSYSIEGEPIVLNFGYDPAEFYLAPSTLALDAKGSNMALLYESSPSGNEELVQNLGYVVAAVSVVFLLGSTPFHRIIGLETFQVTQLVFFSRYLVADSSADSFQALNSLKYIDLYNYFANYPNVRYLAGPLIRLGFTKSFLFNVLIQLFLVAVAWVFFAVFNRTFQRVKRMNIAESNSILEMFKKYKLLTYIFANIVFTLTVSTFFILVFSYLSCAQPQQELTTSLPAELVFLNVAIFAYAGVYICYYIYTNFREARKYNEEEGCYYRYLTIFLGYYLVSSTITVGSGPTGKYALAGVQVAYLLVLVFYRPYLLGMHNVSLIINQTVVVGFSALLILNDMASFLHDLRGYVLIGVELLLVAVNGLGTVRLYVHAKYNQKAFEKAKIDAEKAKQGPKEEFKIPEQNKHKKISNDLRKTIFERQKELREKEESTLQRLKNRLKQEFKEKGEEERGSLMEHERL